MSRDEDPSEGSPVLHQVRGIGTRSRPNRDSSQSVPAWPLRPASLLTSGWLHTRSEERFEQGFLNECGLAQVGFDLLSRNNRWSHRLRLNSDTRQLTPDQTPGSRRHGSS